MHILEADTRYKMEELLREAFQLAMETNNFYSVNIPLTLTLKYNGREIKVLGSKKQSQQYLGIMNLKAEYYHIWSVELPENIEAGEVLVDVILYANNQLVLAQENIKNIKVCHKLVLAQYANQEFIRIMTANDTSNGFKIQVLEGLMSLAQYAMTNEQRLIYKRIKDVIKILKKQESNEKNASMEIEKDKDKKHQLISDATVSFYLTGSKSGNNSNSNKSLANSVVSSVKQPNLKTGPQSQAVQKNLIRKRVCEYNLDAGFFTLKNEQYQLLTQKENFIDLLNSSAGVISFDPALTTREAILLKFSKSSKLRKSIEKILKQYSKFYVNPKQNFRKILIKMMGIVDVLFRGTDIDSVIQAAQHNPINTCIIDNKEVFIVSLNKYIEQRQGDYLQKTLLTASLLAEIFKDYEDIQIHQFRNIFIHDKDEARNYTWIIVMYNKKIFSIDLTDPGNSVYELSNPIQRIMAINRYKKRGLPGILNQCLQALNLLPDYQIPIPSHLVADISDEFFQILKDKSLVCALTGKVLLDPVSIEGDEGNCLFERAAIIEHFRKFPKIHPMIKESCSEELVNQAYARDTVLLELLIASNKLIFENRTGGILIETEKHGNIYWQEEEKEAQFENIKSENISFFAEKKLEPSDVSNANLSSNEQKSNLKF